MKEVVERLAKLNAGRYVLRLENGVEPGGGVYVLSYHYYPILIGTMFRDDANFTILAVAARPFDPQDERWSARYG